MKRIVSVLCLMALLVTLCACGSSDTVSRTPAEIADEIFATQTFQDMLTPLEKDMIAAITNTRKGKS